MRDYLDQVDRVAQTDLYYLTLAATLVIPDMCSGLQASDGKTTPALYQAWFDYHVAPRYTVGVDLAPSFSGEDCYGLRCGMLHQGRLEPHKGAYSRIVFLEPNGNVTMHNNVADDVLNLDVTQFAQDMVGSARQWLVTAEQTAVYRANYPRYMQRYPNGLAPFILGYPVIA
jgi:hypothetical protein